MAVKFDKLTKQAADTVTGSDLNRVQANVDATVKQLGQGDKLVTVSFASASTDTPLYHHLGRPMVGYRVVRSADYVNIRDGSPSPLPNDFANVQCLNITTVTFEVF
jgi:hypothetical protein